jgi:hypothetical protein
VIDLAGCPVWGKIAEGEKIGRTPAGVGRPLWRTMVGEVITGLRSDGPGLLRAPDVDLKKDNDPSKG